MHAVNCSSTGNWRKCIEHVKKEVDADLTNERLDISSVQELVINLAPGESDDDSWEGSDDDSDIGVSSLE